MIVTTMPPHKPICANFIPFCGDCPCFIALISIQPTIIAGMLVNGPQQTSPANAKPQAVIARWLAAPEDIAG